MTPLLCAAGSGHRGVVQSIIRCAGVNVNCSSSLTGYTPLIWAADRGHAEGGEELLNQPDIVKILLKQPNIEVNAVDVDGHTALIWAADKGNVEVANHLLSHPNIDPNLQDFEGLSALICAATTRQVGMVK